MRVLLFGATGMVGAGVLLECLDDVRVTQVTSLVRRPSGTVHPKLREVACADFFDYAPVAAELQGVDACFFCLGVTALGLSEAEYARLTHDLTLAAATALRAASPQAVFCYVSGAGTDSTERGRVMWARVKGRTENALLALGFRGAYMFRPGIIQPLKGVRSKTWWYQAIYTVTEPVTPLLRRLAPKLITTSVHVGRAMIEVALHGDARQFLSNADINEIAERPAVAEVP